MYQDCLVIIYVILGNILIRNCGIIAHFLLGRDRNFNLYRIIKKIIKKRQKVKKVLT